MIKNHKVIVCAGSGGVGKTTLASTIAVRACQLGRRTLVLTVDPAKRLATALGIDLFDDKDHRVHLPHGHSALHAAVIDSKKIFDRFLQEHSDHNDVVHRIMNNRLYQQMSTTLAGSQEFTALERLLASVESGKYDLVVLDTPPTKHAVDFFTAPERIQSLFQEGITKWFSPIAETAKGGLIANLFGRGTRTVIKSLEVLTGGQFIEELIDFFSSIRSIQKVILERSERVSELLKSKETAFVIVTSFDAAKLLEAKYLQKQIDSFKCRLKFFVINRAFPIWLPEPSSLSSEERSEPAQSVFRLFQEFRQYYDSIYRQYDEFERDVDPSIGLVRIPEYGQDVVGLKDLVELASALETYSVR